MESKTFKLSPFTLSKVKFGFHMLHQVLNVGIVMKYDPSLKGF